MCEEPEEGLVFIPPQKAFDSQLGYPGEGPGTHEQILKARGWTNDQISEAYRQLSVQTLKARVDIGEANSSAVKMEALQAKVGNGLIQETRNGGLCKTFCSIKDAQGVLSAGGAAGRAPG